MPNVFRKQSADLRIGFKAKPTALLCWTLIQSADVSIGVKAKLAEYGGVYCDESADLRIGFKAKLQNTLQLWLRSLPT